MILELCEGVHCVDLGESFQTHIYLQNLASIQPRTSPVTFARSTRPEYTTQLSGGLRPHRLRAPEAQHADAELYEALHEVVHGHVRVRPPPLSVNISE